MSSEKEKEEHAGFAEDKVGQDDIKGDFSSKLSKKKPSAAFEKALAAVENMNKDKLH